MTTKQYCSIGGTGEVFVNNSSVGTYNGVITVETSLLEYWDYIFTGIGANRGCKTYYSVIYREPVDVTPVWTVTSRSGRSGSCSLPVKDVRASVSNYCQ